LNVAERISQRPQLIQDFVGEFGDFVPPVRTMLELLAANGCVAGPQTISTDYRELGYAKPGERQVPLPIEVSASTKRQYARFATKQCDRQFSAF
jgi:hypothetical protein